ncbi:MAG TPA: hypothetical protein VFU00_08040, partial [Gemmatimonadales bacterium]|nr:hypothetical protein [Gemmatimonadales bacterium]
MTERAWWIALVRLSDSFGATVAELSDAAGARTVEWAPGGGPPPPGTAAVVILAGGAEAEAIETLPGVAASAGPVYVVGAATDHRLATAAIRGGATDYFALPGDLELLRRALEREQREIEARSGAQQFADTERKTNGFDAILGRSPAVRATLASAARVAMHRDVTVLIGGETGT